MISMEHDAVWLPICVATVMVAMPGAMPVTRPELLTVAMALSLLVQVTLLSVAFEGRTVAVSWTEPFTAIDDGTGWSMLTLVGRASVTVTAHVAVLLPSAVVAVIVAVPFDTALTVTESPVPLTVAMALSLLVHVTFLFVAFDGWIVAVSVSLSPTEMSAEALLSETLVTAMLLSLLLPHDANSSNASDMIAAVKRRR
jgi:hypothetical protein